MCNSNQVRSVGPVELHMEYLPPTHGRLCPTCKLQSDKQRYKSRGQKLKSCHVFLPRMNSAS
uniref:Uncharacterized protein n=1 Tax=Anguilla anguilla TaxID=7936 RepID=A0A0E9UBG1_ANGAN